LHNASADTILATKNAVDEIKVTLLESKNSTRISHDATEAHENFRKMLDGMHQLLDASEKSPVSIISDSKSGSRRNNPHPLIISIDTSHIP
jgi:hypothetical protein